MTVGVRHRGFSLCQNNNPIRLRASIELIQLILLGRQLVASREDPPVWSVGLWACLGLYVAFVVETHFIIIILLLLPYYFLIF